MGQEIESPCWWSGDSRSQGISSHGTDLVRLVLYYLYWSILIKVTSMGPCVYLLAYASPPLPYNIRYHFLSYAISDTVLLLWYRWTSKFKFDSFISTTSVHKWLWWINHWSTCRFQLRVGGSYGITFDIPRPLATQWAFWLIFRPHSHLMIMCHCQSTWTTAGPLFTKRHRLIGIGIPIVKPETVVRPS